MNNIQMHFKGEGHPLFTKSSSFLMTWERKIIRKF